MCIVWFSLFSVRSILYYIVLLQFFPSFLYQELLFFGISSLTNADYCVTTVSSTGTDLPASLPRTPLQDVAPDDVSLRPAVPGPSTSQQTPLSRPRLRQKLTPSKFTSMLFRSESDEDDSGSDMDVDGREYGWLDEDHTLDSSFSSDKEEPLHATQDRDLCEGEDEEERQAPVREPSGFSFAWSEGSNFVPDLHEFQSDRGGITKDWPCNDEAKESDFFRAFLDDEVMSYIAEKTNNYYRWESQRMDFISPKSRFRQWVDTTSRELLVFIALVLVMPLCKKHVLQHYWRIDPLIQTPMFGKYMTRDRFLLLLSFLYFADSENRNTGDRIWEVREILSIPSRKWWSMSHSCYTRGASSSNSTSRQRGVALA